jgi:geranylgeranyl diphosphate synthase, type II
MNPSARSVARIGSGPPPSPTPGAAPAPGPLARFTRAHLRALEEALAEAVTPPPGLHPAVGETIARAVGLRGAPGSRWRPLLTLATAEAVGADPRKALPAAVAVELTHTASLVLDDLPCMDDAAERRGRAATHLEVGAGGAILVALSMLARSAELLGSLPNEGGRLSASWGRAFGLAGMSGGQAVDLTGAFMNGGAARRLHRRKTTALSELALEAGARCGGASEPTVERLVRFGRDLGWAYQLADDAQDWREDGRLGRGPGGRAPRVQSERLLGRALRHLDATPELSSGGRRLLGALARRAAGFPSAGEARRWG